MKQIIFLLIIATAISCKKDENTECNSISYNTTISALVGQKYCIDDANYLIIDAIDNQLCPCNADCFWEGEFILKMKVAATGKEYTYEFGSSEKTPDIQPFDDFKIRFISITPNECDVNNQKNFMVELKIEKN
ncbi:MAG: hypothetical protein IPN86_21700 [Saprospiraceae bacterium]|jgi:hypothetical protein|nr:hypothetical protein [Saprospiraceae bacterium]